jgi:hypothetical protein
MVGEGGKKACTRILQSRTPAIAPPSPSDPPKGRAVACDEGLFGCSSDVHGRDTGNFTGGRSDEFVSHTSPAVCPTRTPSSRRSSPSGQPVH